MLGGLILQTTVYVYSSSSLHSEMIKLILNKAFDPSIEVVIMNNLEFSNKMNSFFILDDTEYNHQDIIHHLNNCHRDINRKCLILIECERKQTINSFLSCKVGSIISYRAAYLELAKGIQHLLDGKIYFSERIKTNLIEDMFSQKNDSSLTNRELEIVSLIGRGLSAQEIANKLKCSPMTINVHRANIKKKLGLTHNNHFIKYCIDSLNSQATLN